MFEEGLFYIMDAHNGWVVAQCQLADSTEDEWETLQFAPSNCTEWETIVNDSFVEQRSADDTFSVQMDTQCASTECSDTAAPDTLCMDKNSIMHGV